MVDKKNIENILREELKRYGYTLNEINKGKYNLGIVTDKRGFSEISGFLFFLRARENKKDKNNQEYDDEIDFDSIYAKNKGLNWNELLKIYNNDKNQVKFSNIGWFAVKDESQVREILDFILPYIIKELEK